MGILGPVREGEGDRNYFLKKVRDDMLQYGNKGKLRGGVQNKFQVKNFEFGKYWEDKIKKNK